MIHKRLLLTGAGGFLGRRLQARLLSQGRRVLAVQRAMPAKDRRSEHELLEILACGPIEAITDYSQMLSGVDAVVHLAGRAHVLRESAADPEKAFMEVNARATAKLARAAGDLGISRLVFISSIAVNGLPVRDTPLTELDPPKPRNSYGRSKLAAEEALFTEHTRSGLPVTVLRPPMVYGPSLKGNFPRLLRLAESGIPLPLANLRNLRSFIYVDNLVDLITACLDRPHPGYGVYLVSDNEDISTPGLIGALRDMMGKRKNLFRFPQPVLRAAATAIGAKKTFESLCGRLCIDPSKAMRELDWTPRFSLMQGLAASVDWYLSNRPPKS
ncbi:MAG: NAD-dependent epimerase/dehydratase family protein [Desulfovibrionaceae bacterium]|nr:NAD-dependent epimerase/dehydratase family protein [Desulfovibrionaceae bacterium]MBF0512457.1 NAD-dependent epimerase/dehydratase family protein [Desulfovibrionaceae bacterium]